MDDIKKESEVTKVADLTDNDNIRITLADGRSASIKTEDLMPVVMKGLGKLLGNADISSTFTNILVNNGMTLGKATIENLAAVVSEGRQNVNTVDTLDFPPSIPFQYGYYFNNIQQQFGIYLHISSAGCCLQIFVGYNNSFFKIRTYDQTKSLWNSWKRIY